MGYKFDRRFSKKTFKSPYGLKWLKILIDFCTNLDTFYKKKWSDAGSQGPYQGSKNSLTLTPDVHFCEFKRS